MQRFLIPRVFSSPLFSNSTLAVQLPVRHRPIHHAQLRLFARMSIPTSSSPVEEETAPTYEPQRFYPAKLGEVLDSRYTVVSKLGFGTNSTIWLCRDRVKNTWLSKFARLSINSGIATLAPKQTPSRLLQFFNSIQIEHPGINSLRLLRSHFEVQGHHGTHPCLVHTPLGMNLLQLRNIMPKPSAAHSASTAHLVASIIRLRSSSPSWCHSYMPVFFLPCRRNE
ncbi:hypothetical protein V2G26_005476 [Clonostachys chloroleuca]